MIWTCANIKVNLFRKVDVEYEAALEIHGYKEVQHAEEDAGIGQMVCRGVP